MKKTVKVLTVLLLAIILITFATNVLAADSPIFTFSEFINVPIFAGITILVNN